MFQKANWDDFKVYMTKCKDNLMANTQNKTSNELWDKLKNDLQTAWTGMSKFVPTKILRSKRSLPWITQDVLRSIRKRDHLHKKQKTSGKPKDRKAFLDQKHLAQRKLRKAHSEYLENLLGLHNTSTAADTESKCSPKKLFSYIKNTRQDSCGITPLRKDGLLHTDNKVKASILNEQFQSVFTQKSPLSLQQLSKIQAQNYAIEGKLDYPPGCVPEFPDMPDITISVAGIDKLLKNLQPNKATGPDD